MESKHLDLDNERCDTMSHQRDQRSLPFWKLTLSIVGGCALAAAGGCGGDFQGGAGDDDIERTEAAITTTTTTDASGQLTVRVKTCDYPSTAVASQTVFCTVDLGAGFVLVGGGAEIEGEGSPGALLQASYPDPVSSPPYSRWVATSTQYAGNFNHRLRAYSIGLKVTGLTTAELQRNLFQADGTDGVSSSSPSYSQEVAQFIGNDFTVVGGGGLVLPPAPLAKPALYLTQSFLEGGSGWRTSAHDNGTGAVGQVKSVAIAIRTCPVRGDDTPWGCLSIGDSFSASGATSTYVKVTNGPAPGDVITSVGGYGLGGFSIIGTRPRFLADLIPFDTSTSPRRQGSTTTTKLGPGTGTHVTGTIYTTMRKL